MPVGKDGCGGAIDYNGAIVSIANRHIAECGPAGETADPTAEGRWMPIHALPSDTNGIRIDSLNVRNAAVRGIAKNRRLARMMFAGPDLLSRND
jgi:hypothetical protein